MAAWMRNGHCRGVYIGLAAFSVIRPNGKTSSMSNCNGPIGRRSRSNTVGIIVIGDEILKGYTVDTNSHFLCRRLFERGIKVEKISVIQDDVEMIAKEVRDFSEMYGDVITSGGVGPTHDDVTFAGVAEAFGDELVVNKDLASLVRGYFRLPVDDVTSPPMKLCLVPSCSQLLWGTDKSDKKSLYPVVRVRNVTVLPGIPKLLERAFDFIEKFFPSGVDCDGSGRQPFHHFDLFLTCDEFAIAKTLTETAAIHPNVNIGSYPKMNHSYYRVKVVVDSWSEEKATAVYELLKAKLSEFLINYDPNPSHKAPAKFEKYLSVIPTDVGTYRRLLDDTIRIISTTLENYPLDNVCISFNGGKDCTALLHLLHVAVQRNRAECRQSAGVPKLKALYIEPTESFIEVEQFISETCQRYDIELLRLRGSIKQALFELKQSRPAVSAIFMGTRRSDFADGRHVEPVVETDAGWPRFTRVQPLSDWNYAAVWRLIRDLQLPYCSLYDNGYTSLGCKTSTVPNEALRYSDNFGRVAYRAAYKLEDESLERHSRPTPNGEQNAD